MIHKSFKKITLAVVVLLCGACGRSFDQPEAQNFTLGAVQMKVHRGMSQGEVAEALGAPNIVTKDTSGVTTWIYDKIGTDVEYYERGGGFWLVILGAQGGRGGTRTNQRTLTAVVKFDTYDRVDNLTYHSSKY